MQDGPAVGGRRVDGRLPDGAALDPDDAADRVGDRGAHLGGADDDDVVEAAGRPAGRRCGRCSAGRPGGRARRRRGRRWRPRPAVRGRATAAGRWSTATFHGRRAASYPGSPGRWTRPPSSPRRAAAGPAEGPVAGISVRSMVMVVLLRRWIGGATVAGGRLESTWSSTWSRDACPRRAPYAARRGGGSPRPGRGESWPGAGRPRHAEAAGPGRRACAVPGLAGLRGRDRRPALGATTRRPGVTATLQAYVSQLRRVLEPDRQRRAPATVLVTVAPGYALRVPDEAVDAHRFEQAVTAEHRRLAAARLRAAAARRRRADRGRGAPGSTRRWPSGAARRTPSSGTRTAAVAERARLEELRAVALEDRAMAGLALGHHATVAAELEALTAAYPLRERLWALRALALTRSGRQADALEVLRQVREVLDEELGLEPSARAARPADRGAAPGPGAGLGGARAGPVGRRPEPGPGGGACAAGGRTGRPPPSRSPRGRWWAATTTSPCWRPPLAAAEAGRPSYAVLTGDAGHRQDPAGRRAGAAGPGARAPRVLVGRCSQDDGAPPLWPWKSGARRDRRGEPRPTPAGGDGGGRGRPVPGLGADHPGGPGRGRARSRPWWCSTTCTGPTPRRCGCCGCWSRPRTEERLLVLTTWRAAPGADRCRSPTSPSRSPGCTPCGSSWPGCRPRPWRRCSSGVSQRDVSPARRPRALRDRTDGNPFFLVEFARLAGERAGLDALLADDDPPTAVSEVLTRRLARLPDETVRALRTAAVIGRQFDTPTLAAATGIDEDDLLDVVEPAQAAGLVREDGVDRFLLLARAGARHPARADARRAGGPARTPGSPGCSREAGGRETEVARHWLEAGPAHAAAGLARRRGRGASVARRPARLRRGWSTCCARRWRRWRRTPGRRPATGTTCCWR